MYFHLVDGSKKVPKHGPGTEDGTDCMKGCTWLLILLAELAIFKSLICHIHDIIQPSQEMTKRGFQEVTVPIKRKGGAPPQVCLTLNTAMPQHSPPWLSSCPTGQETEVFTAP